MAVRHILKDGTEVASVAGRVIRQEEFPALYEVIGRIGNGKKKAPEKEPVREEKKETA